MLEEKWHVCEYYIIFGSTKLIFIFRDKTFPRVLSRLAGCRGQLSLSTHFFWVSPSLLILEAAQESLWCEKHIALLELKDGFEGCDVSHTSYERGPSVREIKQKEGTLLSSGRNRDLSNLCNSSIFFSVCTSAINIHKVNQHGSKSHHPLDIFRCHTFLGSEYTVKTTSFILCNRLVRLILLLATLSR